LIADRLGDRLPRYPDPVSGLTRRRRSSHWPPPAASNASIRAKPWPWWR